MAQSVVDDGTSSLSTARSPLHESVIANSSGMDSSLHSATSLLYVPEMQVSESGGVSPGTSKSLFPGAALSSTNNGPEAEIDPVNFDFEAQFPSWLLDEDFHIGLLDTPLMNSMAELGPGWPDPSQTTDPYGASSRVPNMKQMWFTCTDERYDNQPDSVPASPSAMQTEVDDSYRQTLHQSLQIRPVEQALPSADFLNLCVRSYFARFHPVFPVIHAPTFRPSKANSMLLLSICSVGSLFTGSTHAIRQGVQIFERLHKAVLANWDRLITRGTDGLVSIVQTAIIGQTFGLLSGHPKHLATVDAFHGTTISWARQSSMFKTRKMIDLDLNVSPPELEQKWRAWAKNEEFIRIVLGLHIHDAELASIFYHEPFLYHGPKKLPIAASNQVFMATRAEDWRLACMNDASNSCDEGADPASVGAVVGLDISAVPSDSYFTAYTALQGICVAILENRLRDQMNVSTMHEISSLLMSFYDRFLSHAAPWASDHLDMSILWHLAFMSMFADFDLLERAIGRDGPDLSAEDQVLITRWANSDHAKRCVIHGTMIQKKLENLPLGFEPAIHVPRAMFRAGIAWFCYTRFGLEDNPTRGLALDNLDFPELRMLGVNPALLLFQANGYRHGRPTAIEVNGALCGLTDLLRRIGHWEIARKFAAILGALLHNEGDS